MKIGPQMYVNGSAQAVEFYQKAFGLTLGFHVRNEDNTLGHTELMLGDTVFLALSERKDRANTDEIYKCPEQYHPAMQFCVFDLGEEGVRRAYDVLKEGAVFAHPLEANAFSELCSGLMDKYGVFWWIAK